MDSQSRETPRLWIRGRFALGTIIVRAIIFGGLSPGLPITMDQFGEDGYLTFGHRHRIAGLPSTPTNPKIMGSSGTATPAN